MWIAWAVYFRTHRRDCFPRIACATIVLYVYVHVVFDFPLQVWIAIFEGEKLVSEGEGGVVTHTCMYTYIYMCVCRVRRGVEGWMVLTWWRGDHVNCFAGAHIRPPDPTRRSMSTR